MIGGECYKGRDKKNKDKYVPMTKKFYYNFEFLYSYNDIKVSVFENILQ